MAKIKLRIKDEDAENMFRILSYLKPHLKEMEKKDLLNRSFAVLGLSILKSIESTNSLVVAQELANFEIKSPGQKE